MYIKCICKCVYVLVCIKKCVYIHVENMVWNSLQLMG